MTKIQQVVISISGGVAYVHSKPLNVELVIIDYDVENSEDNDQTTEVYEIGSSLEISEHSTNNDIIQTLQRQFPTDEERKARGLITDDNRKEESDRS